MPTATPVPVPVPVADVLPQIATDDIGVAELMLENEFLRRERDEVRGRVEVLEKRLATTRFGVSLVVGDNSSCQFYTGLHWDVFKKTFKFLQPHVTEKTKDSLPFMEQFFLTLVRLRMDIPFEMLAGLTGVSETTARAYFWKWIDVGFAELRFLVSWPDREALLETLPAAFKVRYPRLTSIIDCFEIVIEQPSNLKARAQVYSHYKKHPTVKFALVCTPLGAISFVSRVWGGRVWDVELVRKSGFISPILHHSGDQILADRGFTLQDDFAVICSAELIIPAFTKGKPQLSPADVEGTRDIANIRIHVERVIGLLKNRYKILQGTLPLKMVKTLKDEADGVDLAPIDRIVTLCAALCNLGESIVYKK